MGFMADWEAEERIRDEDKQRRLAEGAEHARRVREQNMQLAEGLERQAVNRADALSSDDRQTEEDENQAHRRAMAARRRKRGLEAGGNIASRTDGEPQLHTLKAIGARVVDTARLGMGEEGAPAYFSTDQDNPLTDLYDRGEIGVKQLRAAREFYRLMTGIRRALGASSMAFSDRADGGALSVEEAESAAIDHACAYRGMVDALLKREFDVLQAVICDGVGLVKCGGLATKRRGRSEKVGAAEAYLISGLDRLVRFWRL